MPIYRNIRLIEARMMGLSHHSDWNRYHQIVICSHPPLATCVHRTSLAEKMTPGKKNVTNLVSEIKYLIPVWFPVADTACTSACNLPLFSVSLSLTPFPQCVCCTCVSATPLAVVLLSVHLLCSWYSLFLFPLYFSICHCLLSSRAFIKFT